MEIQRLRQYILHKLKQKGIKPRFNNSGFHWQNNDLYVDSNGHDYVIMINTPIMSVDVVTDIDEIYDIVDDFIDFHVINPIYQPRHHYDETGNFDYRPFTWI